MRTINKLFTVVAMALVMVGAAFALPVREVENKKFDKSVEWTQEIEKVGKMSFRKAKSDAAAEINHINFMVGHYLMRTVYDAVFAEMDETNYDAVIEDIYVLLEIFDGKPEQAKLEELLKAVEEGTAGVEEISEIILEIEESYRAGLSEEEDWFLLYGEWTTCLIGDVFLEEDEYIFEDLAALQKLADNAPETVAANLLTPVSGLSRFTEQDGFTAEDYQEMQSVAFDIFDLVLGE